MSDTVIKVENLSKQYRLGQIGTGTLRHDLNRIWYRLRGKEDPYLKIGQINDRTKKANSDFVWALQDINFEVKKGEVLGIIGRNGAGKSTLLKILSKITKPTTGKIHVNGRIASLLEVGTGFHPELSGRENIFLNGAILGMRKWEIQKKFDEIVDFAGVEAYIDTPVKRYSSGMYVRLAFAVAAFLEPEILIIDEVLAVGDAEFQKKCIGRMKDVSTNEGRTVLFVSHNMAAVSNLCENGIYLMNGQLDFKGDIESVMKKYLYQESGTVSSKRFWDPEDSAPGNQFIRLVGLEVNPFRGTILDTSSGLGMTVFINNFKLNTRLGFNLKLITANGTVVFTLGQRIADGDSKQGIYKVNIEIPDQLLNQGVYFVRIFIGEHGSVLADFGEDIFSFEVLGKMTSNGINPERLQGVTMPKTDMKVSFIENLNLGV